MEKFDWKKLLQRTQHVSDVPIIKRAVKMAVYQMDREEVIKSIRRALVTLGFGLCLVVLTSGKSWAVRSPLLNMIGGLVFFFFSLMVLLTGALWGFVSGSKLVCSFGSHLFPFGVQPYRSLSAIPAVFILAALTLNYVLVFSNRFPWFARHETKLMTWLRRSLWLLVVAVWLTAVALCVSAYSTTVMESQETNVEKSEVEPETKAEISDVNGSGETYVWLPKKNVRPDEYATVRVQQARDYYSGAPVLIDERPWDELIKVKVVNGKIEEPKR